jgi:hypothetical protein
MKYALDEKVEADELAIENYIHEHENEISTPKRAFIIFDDEEGYQRAM